MAILGRRFGASCAVLVAGEGRGLFAGAGACAWPENEPSGRGFAVDPMRNVLALSEFPEMEIVSVEGGIHASSADVRQVGVWY